ncbi:hypothetical protein Nepgr_002253 [Nepenthes gracilis]|uniref:Acid phosphatase/vanadium-dependent haloperoxidase-related protein n=1 Tax=Nepenthes gracilis TaxID=150966 RepID=A0AAD3P9G2_NEPGR|nr:hypothetical protein Nepgr_002253 [Nepenthes gracilis]
MNSTATAPFSYFSNLKLRNFKTNFFRGTTSFYSSFPIFKKNLSSNKPGKTSFCFSCRLPHHDPRNRFFKFSSAVPVNLFSLVSPILQSITNFATMATINKWGYLEDVEIDGIISSINTNILQNGGLGMALLSVTSTAKVRISPFVSTLAANPTFVSGLLSWFIAQSIKIVLNFFVERKWDLRILFASGGMPSSHSALCTALTTSVALCHGVADSLFPVCLGFSLIVMYDAIGVRRHAGMQAMVLNKIIEDLFQGHPMRLLGCRLISFCRADWLDCKAYSFNRLSG